MIFKFGDRIRILKDSINFKYSMTNRNRNIGWRGFRLLKCRINIGVKRLTYEQFNIYYKDRTNKEVMEIDYGDLKGCCTKSRCYGNNSL